MLLIPTLLELKKFLKVKIRSFKPFSKIIIINLSKSVTIILSKSFEKP